MDAAYVVVADLLAIDTGAVDASQLVVVEQRLVVIAFEHCHSCYIDGLDEDVGLVEEIADFFAVLSETLHDL